MTLQISDRDPVFAAAARTPFGRLGGALGTVPAVDLGARVIAEVVARSGIDSGEVEQVIMGTVITAGMGQVPARQAAFKAGLPPSTSALTVNKVCASSLKAINLAALMIRAGDADVVVAGGMESMSLAPHLLPGARTGFRIGDTALVDSMQRDGLICPEGNCLMVNYGSEVAAEFEVSREAQDEWSVASQARYAEALAGGHFAQEIVPVSVKRPRGEPLVVEADEQPRPGTTLDALAALPALTPGGSITAGNAPGVNDGASAVLVVSGAYARAHGLSVLGAWRGAGESAEPVRFLATVPASATQAALRRAGWAAADLDLAEINEAFAAVAITSSNLLGLEHARVNVGGGAIAVGHPIGASGARILMTLLNQLGRRGGGRGVAAICSGMAQGEATLVEVGAGA